MYTKILKLNIKIKISIILFIKLSIILTKIFYIKENINFETGNLKSLQELAVFVFQGRRHMEEKGCNLDYLGIQILYK